MTMNRNALMTGAGLTLAGLGVAAGIAFRASAPAEPPAPATVATHASLAPNEMLVESPPAAVAAAPPRAGTPVPKTGAPAAVPPARQAARCSHCGVVESVHAVQQKGQGTGVGAVAGGVVGGAIGNQFGRGDGRTAMTVLGAVGGGLAGNEIEKRARSETVYEVRVRMDDGSLRTLRQRSAPKPGARVVVEGNTLKLVKARSGAAAS
ncbi:MAG TPA: glycine zipper 2TM domain-containing protein [Albitalea sp.]